MLSLIINGEAATVPDDWSVRDLVADRTGREVSDDGKAEDGSSLGVAIAIDEAVVPRSRWAQTQLTNGARCEFVTAVQGG